MPLLAVRELAAGYGPVEVLRGVDLEVGEGEIVALLGPNGAGKTTLNRVVSGLLRPRAGEVRFDGAELSRLPPQAIVEAGLVHVPEGRRVFPDLSVHENLLLGAYRRGRSRRAANLERVYGLFPRLAERRRQAAGTLSGGEQQMLAIGRALMAEPRLLILDEPSLGLAPLVVEQVLELLVELNRAGLAVLLVEQNVVQSLAVARRAYVLEQGRIVAAGPSDTLLADERLRRAYLGL
jgi:branched-chain amino acid transport system ATP-binding protein